MSDDKKPSETPLTVEMLRRAVRNAAKDAEHSDDCCAYRALKRLRHELFALQHSVALAARPEPKFKKKDWVIRSDSPGRVGQVTAVDAGVEYGIHVKWASSASVYCADELLPIPPKPDKVQEGFKLTGVVREVVKGDVYCDYQNGDSVLNATGDDYSSCELGGRHWIVELDDEENQDWWWCCRNADGTWTPKRRASCPRCHKELPL